MLVHNEVLFYLRVNNEWVIEAEGNLEQQTIYLNNLIATIHGQPIRFLS